MFKQFYKDIDTLHELVKPFRLVYIMDDWQSSFDDLVRNIGILVEELSNNV